jgi:hypothetical protein
LHSTVKIAFNLIREIQRTLSPKPLLWKRKRDERLEGGVETLVVLFRTLRLPYFGILFSGL